MEVKIIHETPDYLVISKPIGVAVHPGADRDSFTMRDWLIEKYPEILKKEWRSQDRVGVIHRLDKDTSGIMLMAKTPEALDFFQNQFRNREVEKYYRTLVFNKPPQEHGFVDVFIKRDWKDRKKQSTEAIDFGLDWRERKNSASEYWIEGEYSFKGQPLSLVLVRIFTGRKHQIRAHMKYEGCPVIGDPTYNIKPSKRLSKQLGLERQFLHAVKLKVSDYKTGLTIEFNDDLPQDLNQILAKLKPQARKF